MDTAILFLVFNRPASTARVFEAIRAARPPRLYVAADGPRLNMPDDVERVAEVRRIAMAVDWPCELRTRFQSTNLGGQLGPVSGIDWFFDNEAEGTILEDDCLPDPSFFRFAEELLDRYRGEATVMMISGNCFPGHNRTCPESYAFSRNTHIWGWATWRRAWRLYDRELRHWPAIRNTPWLLRAGDGHRDFRNHWEAVFDQLYACERPWTWDYQWTFSCWTCGGLAVVPCRNLVTNIGFGEDATRTTSNDGRLGGVPSVSMAFPLFHPSTIYRDVLADRWEDLNVHHVRVSALRKMLRRIPALQWARVLARRLMVW